jgi:maleylpyruvate isomerase
MVPREDIQAVADSHARLIAAVRDLTDEYLRRPSRLPDWSVGHVLTHLARNADSVVRRLAAATEGHLVTQYEGGAEGRAADIDTGSGRPSEELLADLEKACTDLDEQLSGVPEEVWSGEVMAGSGATIPAPRVVYARWREVEIHHVDLGLDYEPGDWPTALVERMLPELLETLPERSNHALLLAWAVGRAEAPLLADWA